MKIALSGRRFRPPFVGGVDVYTDRLRLAFQRLGHDIIVLAYESTAGNNNGNLKVSPDEYDGTQVWRIQFAIAGRPQEAFDYGYDQEMGRVIKSVLKDQKPDLFIITNFYLSTLASVQVAKELGIPIVHIATDFLPICRRATFIRWDGNPCNVGESVKSCTSCFVSHRSSGRLASSLLQKLSEETLVQLAKNQDNYKFPHPLSILKPYWKQISIMESRLSILHPLRQNIDLVLAPTQYTFQRFLENGFRPDQVHLLPFGVEMNHPLANIHHNFTHHMRFLFIGRLHPYKGAHLLVEAFNNLETPKGATLTIYGSSAGYDAYFSHLKALMATNECIQFGGQIAPHELDHAFADADFFILPSTWHENSPLILLDALQSRTPIVASKIAGVTDLIKDGVNGLLFPMGDKHALQQVLQKIIDQPALVEALRTGIHLLDIDEYAKMLIDLCADRIPSIEALSPAAYE